MLDAILGILSVALVIVILGTGLALLTTKPTLKYMPSKPYKATYVVAHGGHR